ncbi:hypothetical protein ILYODFUR_019546 [Ilyodon furcidens]|uniref:Uncharacterized protein n=1 Tax=Ilyodon furcidens TaxID=33524 RepID=A0ABV0VGV7_9TELE
MFLQRPLVKNAPTSFKPSLKNSPGNSTVNHLLQPQTFPLTEITKDYCNNFIGFCSTKNHTIRSALTNICCTFTNSSPRNRFLSSSTASHQTDKILHLCT